MVSILRPDLKTTKPRTPDLTENDQTLLSILPAVDKYLKYFPVGNHLMQTERGNT